MYLFVGGKSAVHLLFFRTSIGRLTKLSEVICRHLPLSFAEMVGFWRFLQKSRSIPFLHCIDAIHHTLFLLKSLSLTTTISYKIVLRGKKYKKTEKERGVKVFRTADNGRFLLGTGSAHGVRVDFEKLTADTADCVGF